MAFCVFTRHSTFLRRMASSSLAGKVRKQPSSDMASFRAVFQKAKHVVALTGAGISAESGIPTFRGAGGLWRKYNAQDLATPGAFLANPSLVWEFYSYRRDLVLSKKPNPAHHALAKAEAQLESEGRRLVVITQNIDELHRDAGTKNLLELHVKMYLIFTSKLFIRCVKCAGLLRPHVVWFGESLDPDVLMAAQHELDQCDLCLVIGTSSVVYPAAMFAPGVADRGVPVAEFNIESTPGTENFGFHFEGFCGSTLPKALGV
ncbi:UNVERIFIED_CONTAM: NAD-dependent protein deacylase sirtuin-5 [Trichonephila clavipes]